MEQILVKCEQSKEQAITFDVGEGSACYCAHTLVDFRVSANIRR